MDVYGTVRAALLSAGGVTAIVGSGNAGRVYPLHLPEKATLPAVTMQVVATEEPANYLSGAGAFSIHRLQVDCWAVRIKDAVALAAAVRAAMDAGTGFSALPAGRQDLQETDTPDTPYRVLLEFNVSLQ